MDETTFGWGILLLSKNPQKRQTSLLIIACDLVFPKKSGFLYDTIIPWLHKYRKYIKIDRCDNIQFYVVELSKNVVPMTIRINWEERFDGLNLICTTWENEKFI